MASNFEKLPRLVDAHEVQELVGEGYRPKLVCLIGSPDDPSQLITTNVNLIPLLDIGNFDSGTHKAYRRRITEKLDDHFGIGIHPPLLHLPAEVARPQLQNEAADKPMAFLPLLARAESFIPEHARKRYLPIGTMPLEALRSRYDRRDETRLLFAVCLELLERYKP